MATSLESRTVKARFADICASIPESDVTTFADELLQADLIGEAGHKEAIELTGSSSRNKVSKLMSEVMTRVAGSQDKLAKFVSILECRNVELAETLTSAYQIPLASSDKSTAPPQRKHRCAGHDGNNTDPSPAPTRRKEQDSFADQYVAQLRQVYSAPPPTWDPLPQCKHIRLAMVKEKGKQYVGADEKITASRVKGKVDDILEVKVPVDMDAIFDDGIFDKKQGCQVILVEAGPGMGKTSLAYYYCQRWADGKLDFGAVAFVRLRDWYVPSGTCFLAHLFFLASRKRMEISNEMARFLVYDKKLLIILDGWDEIPCGIDNSELLYALLTSVSPQTVVLITSRPESSLHLHGQANRVSIIGFTEKDIDEYFRNAFQSELASSVEDVDSACDKLSNHFDRYPVIRSCCYVPLNAAILAYVYLSGGHALPITRFELFRDLVLCYIKRELETHKPVRVLDDVPSFEDLPPDLSEQLHNLCVLAFEGVKNNKIVFSQKELTSFNLPKDLPTLGLLDSLEGYGPVCSRQITYNFIHLAVQELLAAYYISKMESDKHAEVFESLLSKSRSSAVLQFYSAFSQLTNEGVRNFITKQRIFSSGEGGQIKFKLSNSCVSILNCFFEAQLHDESFYRQIIGLKYRMNTFLDLVTLSPLDCISLFYFLSSVHTLTRGNVSVDLGICLIDSHSQAVLLGEFPKHSKSSTTRVLDCVTGWRTFNITDSGLACIGTALTTNNTLKVLTLSHDGDCQKPTDEGLMPLLEGLQNNHSLERLSIAWSSTRPDQSLKKMGESVARSSLKQVDMTIEFPAWLQEKELKTIKEWVQSVQVGATDLMQSLECHQIQHLRLKIVSLKTSSDSFKCIMHQEMNPVLEELNAKVDLVNSKRKEEGFLPITLTNTMLLMDFY